MHHRTLTDVRRAAATGRAWPGPRQRARPCSPCAELRQQPRATAATAISRPRARVAALPRRRHAVAGDVVGVADPPLAGRTLASHPMAVVPIPDV
ncbi:uncharacterized protein M6B38_322575 [Iris pallida]|uniref:Uncharacterized protein n=1 Tax=Iris pallida TaxID=29817 RepID=A0AAX6HCH6_IRIPA|nr:uncharacterized protein M6B38_322575 [Iris pallida]